jgi:hypothetical protein
MNVSRELLALLSLKSGNRRCFEAFTLSKGCRPWGRLLNGSNFSEEKQSRHLRTDLNADGSR